MKRLIWVLVAGLTGLTARAETIASKIVREKIDGIDVIMDRTGVDKVAVLRGFLPAGDVFNPPDNPMIASLVAGMLDKGTATEDKFAVANRLERVGASISFNGGGEAAGFSARCLNEDLELVVSLLAEQLRSPAFSPDELAKLKTQEIARIKRSLDDPASRAAEAFSRSIFPEGHPSRPHTAEERIAGVEQTAVDELKRFHTENYGPAHLTLVAVGDIDPAQLRTEIARAFAGWSGGRDLPPAPPPAPLTGLAGVEREQTVLVPGKTSVNVVWGQATGLRYRDPDAIALRVATAIFGDGFTGRLMGTVRDKMGLTYGIGAGMSGDAFVDGYWSISATFAPILLDKGIDATREQLLRWSQAGATAIELTDRKTNLIGEYQISLATTRGLAEAIVATVQRGYDLTWLDDYPKAINDLTLDQVNGAIVKYLHPKTMTLVKAGTIHVAR